VVFNGTPNLADLSAFDFAANSLMYSRIRSTYCNISFTFAGLAPAALRNALTSSQESEFIPAEKWWRLV
jgi:hypothetical protein